MADAGYWGRRNPLDLSPQLSKRARNDYGLPPREDERAELQTLRDSTAIGASYDRYLQTTQKRPWLCRNWDPIMNQVKTGILDPGTHGQKAFTGQFANQVPTVSAIMPAVTGQGLCLPPEASNSIFIEGLPLDSTEREVAHIFRPFLGYEETRLVKKELKHPDAEQKVFSFVDFTDAVCAMTALNALQGYKLDERKPDSLVLKLKFSRAPDPKSGYGYRRKR
ncbi:uncharacterized protein A4U43_C04F7560 [Asparagus officinalis]|uniref:RRM domain-containing protein n=1 Tax=Asparagus officinalis TaxID=4686 RepID=A0A5P1EZ07_ASPOF|nr:RNA-binding protein 1-like [Asparagus officinalis]ONK71346.1 uncharacterized protein A4U43_C04F7560 [Asparagus officinalis]